MKKLLFHSTVESSLFNEIVMLLLRVTVGLFMALIHGYGKLPVSDDFIQATANLGFPFPFFFAWSAGLTEFLGGILLALGVFTRPVGFFLAITMGVAAFMQHGADPLKVKEMALLYFVLAIVFMVRGGNKFSVDSLIK